MPPPTVIVAAAAVPFCFLFWLMEPARARALDRPKFFSHAVVPPSQACSSAHTHTRAHGRTRRALLTPGPGRQPSPAQSARAHEQVAAAGSRYLFLALPATPTKSMPPPDRTKGHTVWSEMFVRRLSLATRIVLGLAAEHARSSEIEPLLLSVCRSAKAAFCRRWSVLLVGHIVPPPLAIGQTSRAWRVDASTRWPNAREQHR